MLDRSSFMWYNVSMEKDANGKWPLSHRSTLLTMHIFGHDYENVINKFTHGAMSLCFPTTPHFPPALTGDTEKSRANGGREQGLFLLARTLWRSKS